MGTATHRLSPERAVTLPLFDGSQASRKHGGFIARALQLQRDAGNRAVATLVQRQSARPSPSFADPVVGVCAKPLGDNGGSLSSVEQQPRAESPVKTAAMPDGTHFQRTIGDEDDLAVSAGSLSALQRLAGHHTVTGLIAQRDEPASSTAAPTGAGQQSSCESGAAAVTARAVQWLQDAADQLDLLGRPAGAQPDTDRARVSAAVRGLFATDDPGYVALLGQRLRYLASALGAGRVRVECGGTGCTVDQSGSGFVAAYVDQPYTVHLCQTSPNASNDDLIATFIHEAAHAALPDIGVRGEVNGSNVSDRAYTHERMFARLRTEEALDNATSYGVLVRALATRTPQGPALGPTDTVTGCSDPDRVHDALAHVQVWARFAEARARAVAQYLGQPGSAITDRQDALSLVRSHLPNARTRAHLTTIATRLFGLVVALRRAQDVTCRPGRGPVLGTAGRFRVTASGLSNGGRGSGGVTLTEAWIQADEDVRRHTLFALMLVSSGSGVPASEAWAYATLAREVAREQVPPTADRNVARHEFAEERFRMLESRTDFLRTLTGVVRADDARVRAVTRLSGTPPNRREAVRMIDSEVGQRHLQAKIEHARRLWDAGTYGLDPAEPVVVTNRDEYRRLLNAIRQLAGASTLLALRAGGEIRAREDRLFPETMRRLDDATHAAGR